MYPQRLFREAIPLFSFIFILTSLALVAVIRRPVIVVNDKFSSAVYGEKRERAKAAEIMLKLIRRVRIFNVDDYDNSDKIAAAIAERFKNPLCVIFPYRYAQAAVIYANAGGTDGAVPAGRAGRAVILEERNLTRPDTGKALYIPSSWETDYYRAAYIAALLAREPTLMPELRYSIQESSKTITAFTSENLPPQAQQAFESGILSGGWTGKNTAQSSVIPEQIDNIGAAVLISSASSFIQSETGIPSVVFSAASLYMLPSYVKAVVDDSVWALLPGIVRQAVIPAADGDPSITGVPIPAQIKILPFRKIPAKLFLRLYAVRRSTQTNKVTS
ncbi:MAG: hypothetical protein LBG72_08575 [Spirochaetaceae bacterium]|jgi:hypothetical protein|nr:hypothetical protein [Spirochaetaceae bacterium]